MPSDLVEDETQTPRKRPRLRIQALGGPAVEVEAAGFEALVGDVEGVVGGEFSRTTMGQLIEAAKQSGRTALLTAFLLVRDDAAPLYRVRTADGRPWRPTWKAIANNCTATNTEN